MRPVSAVAIRLSGHAWVLHGPLSGTTTPGLAPLDLLGAARRLAPAHRGAPLPLHPSLHPSPPRAADLGAAAPQTLHPPLPALPRLSRLGDTPQAAFPPLEPHPRTRLRLEPFHPVAAR
ncbi:MAG: hypothetical protein VKO26_02705 [Cyanobacteriota bacterium]|nr:hypothetical protein [Cyanobacteriota bacterium]